jgi:hypothetical protein
MNLRPIASLAINLIYIHWRSVDISGSEIAAHFDRVILFLCQSLWWPKEWNAELDHILSLSASEQLSHPVI